MDQILLDIFGAIGLILLLAAFVINHYKFIPRRTFIFNGLNFIGSGILAIYAYYIGSDVFLVLESIWVIISAYFLLDIFHKRHVVKTEKPKKKKK